MPGTGHSIHEPLPGITIAVAAQHKRMGIASELMDKLYELSAKHNALEFNCWFALFTHIEKHADYEKVFVIHFFACICCFIRTGT